MLSRSSVRRRHRVLVASDAPLPRLRVLECDIRKTRADLCRRRARVRQGRRTSALSASIPEALLQHTMVFVRLPSTTWPCCCLLLRCLALGMWERREARSIYDPMRHLVTKSVSTPWSRRSLNAAFGNNNRTLESHASTNSTLNTVCLNNVVDERCQLRIFLRKSFNIMGSPRQ